MVGTLYRDEEYSKFLKLKLTLSSIIETKIGQLSDQLGRSLTRQVDELNEKVRKLQSISESQAEQLEVASKLIHKLTKGLDQSHPFIEKQTAEIDRILSEKFEVCCDYRRNSSKIDSRSLCRQ